MDDLNQTGAELGTRSVPFGSSNVTAREFTIRQRKQFRKIAQDSGWDEAVLWTCSVACVELFSQTVDEIDAKYSPEALGRLALAVLDLSGLIEDNKRGKRSAPTS